MTDAFSATEKERRSRNDLIVHSIFTVASVLILAVGVFWACHLVKHGVAQYGPIRERYDRAYHTHLACNSAALQSKPLAIAFRSTCEEALSVYHAGMVSLYVADTLEHFVDDAFFLRWFVDAFARSQLEFWCLVALLTVAVYYIFSSGLIKAFQTAYARAKLRKMDADYVARMQRSGKELLFGKSEL